MRTPQPPGSPVSESALAGPICVAAAAGVDAATIEAVVTEIRYALEPRTPSIRVGCPTPYTAPRLLEGGANAPPRGVTLAIFVPSPADAEAVFGETNDLVRIDPQAGCETCAIVIFVDPLSVDSEGVTAYVLRKALGLQR